jgi:hypothetical protein
MLIILRLGFENLDQDRLTILLSYRVEFFQI